MLRGAACSARIRALAAAVAAPGSALRAAWRRRTPAPAFRPVLQEEEGEDEESEPDAGQDGMSEDEYVPGMR